jgi:hypothetical protein
MMRADVIAKDTALEIPPPGPGLVTVTLAAPGSLISPALMAAVSWDALTNVVLRLAPAKRTVAPATKLDPLMVSVKSGPPATADSGLRELMTGTGLLMANATEAEVSGLPTVG